MIDNDPEGSASPSGKSLVEELFSKANGSTQETSSYYRSITNLEQGNTSIRVIPQKVLIEGPKSYDDVDILSLSETVENIFRIAENEDFEDGTISFFAIALQNLIENYSNLALSVISQFLFDDQTSVKVVSEALYELGRINHKGTHKNRMHIIEKWLSSESSYIRDSAGLGLSFLDDPSAIPQLKKAIEDEKNPELKKDLELVLKQLEYLR